MAGGPRGSAETAETAGRHTETERGGGTEGGRQSQRRRYVHNTRGGETESENQSERQAMLTREGSQSGPAYGGDPRQHALQTGEAVTGGPAGLQSDLQQPIPGTSL